MDRGSSATRSFLPAKLGLATDDIPCHGLKTISVHLHLPLLQCLVTKKAKMVEACQGACIPAIVACTHPPHSDAPVCSFALARHVVHLHIHEKKTVHRSLPISLTDKDEATWSEYLPAFTLGPLPSTSRSRGSCKVQRGKVELLVPASTQKANVPLSMFQIDKTFRIQDLKETILFKSAFWLISSCCSISLEVFYSFHTPRRLSPSIQQNHVRMT